ncbi:exopolysaccharide synthesis protein [Rhizobium laguerreae]|nr:exopolysaccharide synthesis protein [Rhizobium laguerreae]MBY3197456.1 exopolysaccharide synthesis protein [Rhizobium laguerreae]MBY3231017.1 exopolysaccharide synthesis protein [Rhizobium laguerreae]MBY3333212.1 exopolysaccharide synthesis protein [Rhizobium laguerreae]MBY3559931.1 exopolysaccharide synthesis protein [Rhizobium laguerreae]
MDKVPSAVDPPRDSPPWHRNFPMPSNRWSLLWPGLLISILLLAGTVVFYREIHHLEDPVGPFENRALNKAARSSRIADRPDPAVPSPLPPTSIPLQLIEAPKLELASQFLRIWRVSGSSFCGALREAGIEMSEWKAASMRNRSYECYFQRIYERDEVRPLSSTFVKVRGDEMGDILEIRAKIIGPTTDAQGRLAPAVLRIFEIIVKQACWRDFEDTLASIQNLQNVEYERFGSYLSFTREAGGANIFNFVLGLKATSSSQVKTKTYFSTERWLQKPAVLPRASSSGERLGTSISANCAQ